AGVGGERRALVPEHDEVSAVTPVPADDARSGAVAAPRDGRADAGVSATGARDRPGAAVLLPAAHTADSLPRRDRVLRQVRRSALDVRVADAGPDSNHAAPGLAARAAGDLRDLDCRRAPHVSAVPLVRGSKAAPTASCVELRLTIRRPNVSLIEQTSHQLASNVRH